MDDILAAADTVGWKAFDRVIGNYKHSRIRMITEGEDQMYLGLNVGMQRGVIFLSRQDYLDNKLFAAGEKSFFDARGMVIDANQRRTQCKMAMGSLLWVVQTRP